LRGKFLYKREKKTQNRGPKIRGEKQKQGGADEKNQPRNQSKDRRKNTGNREGVEDE
jgi:hypothetical protein